MLRYSDKKVIAVRTIKSYPGNYPFKMSPQRPLSQPSADSGGEQAESDHQPASVQKPQPLTIKPPNKFHPGADAMTTAGPCTVLGRYSDGDYRVTFPEKCEPQEVRSVSAKDLWLPSDWPDWLYDSNGNRMDSDHDVSPIKRLPTQQDLYARSTLHKLKAHEPRTNHYAHGQAQMNAYGSAQMNAQGQAPYDLFESIDIPDFNYDNEDEHKEAPHRHQTRSTTRQAKIVAFRAASRGPSQYKVWDRGKLKTVAYPYSTVQPPKALAA